ncbi:hypothetical protein HQQ80_10435 [Microbacteriaceae bacterium VKM Ac-2855]|nr:hypothetical protein [Microbacteriaceae bacterium VKM Ac-2855]
MNRPRLVLVAAVSALALPLALTGCSPSKAESCTAIQTGLTDTVTELSAQSAELEADPSAASAAIDDLIAAFETTVGTVSDSEIKPLAQDTLDKLKDFGDEVSAAATATDASQVDQAAVQKATTELQSSLQSLGAACS